MLRHHFLLSLCVSFCAICFFWLSPASASATTAQNCAYLNRGLSLGMRGADVVHLQRVLNQDERTRVAASGPGSSGFESSYFGARTKLAVIAFQNLYAKEILVPSGLRVGNGFVGTLSRAKIAALCLSPSPSPVESPARPSPATTESVSVAPTAPLTPVTPSTTVAPPSVLEATVAAVSTLGFHSDTPVLMFPSAYTGQRGATIKISALGLAPTGNTVHLDSFTIATDAKSIDQNGNLSFVIPSDAPFGQHALWISSGKGETNKTFFVVADQSASPPVITDFSPKEGFFGQVVTVTGSGFLPTGNDVRISYGTISNIPSSDGKTLSFTVSPNIPGLQVGEDRPEFDVRDGYWFAIVNAGGISAHKIFTLKI